MSIFNKLHIGKELAKQHIDRKLRIRLRIYVVILMIMTEVSIYKLLSYTLNIWYVIIGLILWIWLGQIAGRIFTIVRHPGSEQVISHMDNRGIAILIIFILIELNKKILFAHRLQGNQLKETLNNHQSWSWLQCLLFYIKVNFVC